MQTKDTHLNEFFGVRVVGQLLFGLQKLGISLKIRIRLVFFCFIKLIKTYCFKGKLVSKSVFIIFFNGQKLQEIVNRVCDGFVFHWLSSILHFLRFAAKLYSCPKSSKDRQLVEADVLIRLHDLSIVIETTEKHKLGVCLLKVS